MAKQRNRFAEFADVARAISNSNGDLLLPSSADVDAQCWALINPDASHEIVSPSNMVRFINALSMLASHSSFPFSSRTKEGEDEALEGSERLHILSRFTAGIIERLVCNTRALEELDARGLSLVFQSVSILAPALITPDFFERWRTCFIQKSFPLAPAPSTGTRKEILRSVLQGICHTSMYVKNRDQESDSLVSAMRDFVFGDPERAEAAGERRDRAQYSLLSANWALLSFEDPSGYFYPQLQQLILLYGKDAHAGRWVGRDVTTTTEEGTICDRIQVFERMSLGALLKKSKELPAIITPMHKHFFSSLNAALSRAAACAQIEFRCPVTEMCFDVAITDRKGRPIFYVELDGLQHQSLWLVDDEGPIFRLHKRMLDEFKDRCCLEENIPVLRIQTSSLRTHLDGKGKRISELPEFQEFYEKFKERSHQLKLVMEEVGKCFVDCSQFVTKDQRARNAENKQAEEEEPGWTKVGKGGRSKAH